MRSASRARKVRSATGPSHKVITVVASAPASANTPTGSKMRRRPMPSAVRAMISLSADMRPRPSSTPMSTAIGMVKVNTPGKQRRQAHKLRHEENKREDHESKEGMTENFADDIAVQDAHVENAECNTSADSSLKGRRR